MMSNKFRLSPLILIPLALNTKRSKQIGICVAVFFILVHIIASAIATSIIFVPNTPLLQFPK